MPRRLAWAAGALVVLSSAWSAAKNHAVASPRGKRIYEADERFGTVLDQDQRDFVMEAAVGLGPEGNLGLLLGWLNKPIRGLEYYAGIGFESNPARHYTGAVRYVFNIEGYRPYIGVGYLFKDLYVLQTYSHNAFAEIGYSFKLHQTHRLTVGAGVRYIAHVGIRDSSPLRDDDVDPVLLAEQDDDLVRFIPTIALRFSRAF